jgi:hypothetical protein
MEALKHLRAAVERAGIDDDDFVVHAGRVGLDGDEASFEVLLGVPVHDDDGEIDGSHVRYL